MSYPQFEFRPAPVSQPPADQWTSISRDLPTANQPALQLVGEDSAPLRPGSAAVRVDLTAAAIPAAAGAALTAEAEQWAPWFAQLLTEALAGRRRLDALSHWLDDWVLAEISRRVRLRFRDQHRQPTRSIRGSKVTRVDLARVDSVRAQFSRTTQLETTAVVRIGGQIEACAFQLVKVAGRWRCTTLELAPTGPDVGRG